MVMLISTRNTRTFLSIPFPPPHLHLYSNSHPPRPLRRTSLTNRRSPQHLQKGMSPTCTGVPRS
ncbi:hypothetical protein T484DRAFT_1970912 [Baffinella frigidus]|nr:hypothetical protein T484DRAFT_1970912 [Cryptophyta sp. CCMP2293]